MKGRSRWGRRVEERTPRRCKDRLLQGMQKFAAPGVIMDTTNREKQQWGRDRITEMSMETLMAIAWVEIQMPHKITYTEEETSP